MRKVVVIGGGAAGMMSAITAAQNGKKVVLLEKNEKLGKKIYITGKGRCNLTNDAVARDFIQSVVTNPKFIYGAINTFTPQQTMEFFTEKGLSLKTERGNRVFPQSDKASDVTKTLEKTLINLGVDVRYNVKVTKILFDEQKVYGVETENGEISCDSVIVCTGGASYPLTGSDGDGYGFAKEVGHTIERLKPALVGIELKGSDYIPLMGLSLKNVSLTAKIGEKILFTDFGEMLFTHFGVSGPIVLSCSSVINKKDLASVDIYIDLKPALDFNTLEQRLIREFRENNTKELATVMRSLLPKTLIELVVARSGVRQNKNCSEITVNERNSIINVLKSLKFSVKKLRPLDEAIVTSGGVNVKEINPKTMESKLEKGLFFAGEVIDVDAFTGGFNLQLAFSTGYVAGFNA